MKLVSGQRIMKMGGKIVKVELATGKPGEYRAAVISTIAAVRVRRRSGLTSFVAHNVVFAGSMTRYTLVFLRAQVPWSYAA